MVYVLLLQFSIFLLHLHVRLQSLENKPFLDHMVYEVVNCYCPDLEPTKYLTSNILLWQNIQT